MQTDLIKRYCGEARMRVLLYKITGSQSDSLPQSKDFFPGVERSGHAAVQRDGLPCPLECIVCNPPSAKCHNILSLLFERFLSEVFLHFSVELIVIS